VFHFMILQFLAGFCAPFRRCRQDRLKRREHIAISLKQGAFGVPKYRQV